MRDGFPSLGTAQRCERARPGRCPSFRRSDAKRCSRATFRVHTGGRVLIAADGRARRQARASRAQASFNLPALHRRATSVCQHEWPSATILSVAAVSSGLPPNSNTLGSDPSMRSPAGLIALYLRHAKGTARTDPAARRTPCAPSLQPPSSDWRASEWRGAGRPPSVGRARAARGARDFRQPNAGGARAIGAVRAPSEPLADGVDLARHLGLEVGERVDLRRTRIRQVDPHNLPVHLALIDHRQRRERLEAVVPCVRKAGGGRSDRGWRARARVRGSASATEIRAPSGDSVRARKHAATAGGQLRACAATARARGGTLTE